MRRRSLHPSSLRGSTGFALVELLIYTAIVAVVVGAIALVTSSEIRIGRRSEEVQNLKDEWNMAATFMKAEISRADSVSTTVGTYPCAATAPGGTAPDSPLVLEGPNSGAGPAWRVVYGVRSLANLPDGEVATNWIGPNVLVRCGLPYLTTVPSGTLNELAGGYSANDEFFGLLNPAGDVAESVVIDRLPAATSFNPVPAATSSTALARDVDVTLALRTLFGGNGYTSVFRGRASANPNYGLPEYNDALGITCATGLCRTTTFPNQPPFPAGSSYYIWEYRVASGGNLTVSPSGTGTAGDRWEVVVYFPGNIAGYTIQRSASDTNTCSRVSCYVSNGSTTVTINANNLGANNAFAAIVLAFADRERRV